MIDFLLISSRSSKRGVIEVYPKFIIKKSSDLMVRGSDFYAIWDEEAEMWSTDEQTALQIIDKELDRFADETRQKTDNEVRVLHMWDAESGMVDRWHKYVQKQSRDNFHMLDERLIFSNTPTSKKDYASKKLSYPLEAGDMPAYEKLISTLYSPEERHKIEWSIGSIVSGDSKKLQKFLVLYGAAGTGKSTILNIIQQLFEGYYSVFDAKALGSSNNSFALEAFKTNPLVAIQHDGDLSRIEDNTRLNSVVSHELMTVNEKFKSTYASRFKAFLFMGTNKPVKITDAKSGLIRRLIDVTPSGEKLSSKEYKTLTKQVGFELGAIAQHCLEVYEEDPGYYDDYIPIAMLGASNDFYNFVEDSFFKFEQEPGVTLKEAWDMYQTYNKEANVNFPYSQRIFKEELKNYFSEFYDRYVFDDGTRVRSYYMGFKTGKFEQKERIKDEEERTTYRIDFQERESIFDREYADTTAQYASDAGTPMAKWQNVKTTLGDLDTSKLHYVKLPVQHIVIDFDIPGDNGGKDFERNMSAACKWPPTYAELSKSGSGIHLHYIYTGEDPTRLVREYAPHIEIKVFTGDASLRRKLTKCNDLPVRNISSGLPLKEKGDKMVNAQVVKSEASLRNQIKKNLNKEIHPNTKPSIDFIKKILDDAYDSGLKYDVSDMYTSVLSFAMSSNNQADYCIKTVKKMKFKSDEPSATEESKDDSMTFYDVEVYPNLFIVCWMPDKDDAAVERMINPQPDDMDILMSKNLCGHNCRLYDNHIIYARKMGYTNEQLYKLSNKIINRKDKSDRSCFFGEAYGISKADTLDFASAGNKKSLKKLEIEMGIHHQEMGLDWTQPVPEKLWDKVADYCANDVIATRAAFHYLKADWAARQILADLVDGHTNDTTNSLTTKLVFGKERNPQSEFFYRSLADPCPIIPKEELEFLKMACPEMMAKPFDEESILPYFPGYTYDAKTKTSIYKGEEVGEGGYVYAEPGMYGNVALLDVSSMHPHSIIAECLFGPKYTRIFRDLVEGRVDIKHEDWDALNTALDGKLVPYVQKVQSGEMTSKDLANALKTAINSVYGLTAAGFPNPFKDSRNIDNIVAKRGALFMIDLKEEVQKRGFTVAHIKTDSIKIPDATPEIIQFVMDFGKRYGYIFEHEATYDRMCLVNNAVYIAKYDNGKWTATGAQFQQPYVFKKLFSKEDVVFNDMCETKEVKTALYLDMNENLPEGEHFYKFVGKVGLFCPMKEGSGGGVLLRENGVDEEGNKVYAAAGGTKGYRWLEAEEVIDLGKEDCVDTTYYDNLVAEAANDICVYGDIYWFNSEDPYVGPEYVEGEYGLYPVYPDSIPFGGKET